MSEVKLCECGCGLPVKGRFLNLDHYNKIRMIECPWSKQRLQELILNGKTITDLALDAGNLLERKVYTTLVIRWCKSMHVTYRNQGEVRSFKFRTDPAVREKYRQRGLKGGAARASRITDQELKALQKAGRKNLKLGCAASSKIRAGKSLETRHCAFCGKAVTRSKRKFKSLLAFCSRPCVALWRWKRDSPKRLINALSVRRRLDAIGMSQSELARLLSLSITTVNFWLTYREPIPNKHADKLIAILGDSIRSKLSEEPEWANQLTTQGGPDGSNEAAGAREER